VFHISIWEAWRFVWGANPTKDPVATGLMLTIAKKHYEKFVDLVECSISRKNYITLDVRPSKCCVIAVWPSDKKAWRPCSKQ